jgi:hypothetical protein
VDPHDRRATAVRGGQRTVEAAHVALNSGLVEHVEGHDGAARAARLDHAVQLAEERRRARRAAPRRLAVVVGLVEGAELAHPELAEVAHEPAHARAVALDRRELGAPAAQVVARDVQEDLHPLGTRPLHVGRGPEQLGRVVRRVPGDEVANALDLGALEGVLVEHRHLLVADADADGGLG